MRQLKGRSKQGGIGSVRVAIIENHSEALLHNLARRWKGISNLDHALMMPVYGKYIEARVCKACRLTGGVTRFFGMMGGEMLILARPVLGTIATEG